jgi:hypothetical protein
MGRIRPCAVGRGDIGIERRDEVGRVQLSEQLAFVDGIALLDVDRVGGFDQVRLDGHVLIRGHDSGQHLERPDRTVIGDLGGDERRRRSLLVGLGATAGQRNEKRGRGHGRNSNGVTGTGHMVPY